MFKSKAVQRSLKETAAVCSELPVALTSTDIHSMPTNYNTVLGSSNFWHDGRGGQRDRWAQLEAIKSAAVSFGKMHTSPMIVANRQLVAVELLEFEI